jgi:glucokinase
MSVVGIDIGGTNVDVALATSGGDVIRQIRLPTTAGDGPDALFSRLGVAVEHLKATARDAGSSVRAVGCACPGVVQEHGILLAPNLPGWETVALAGRVRQLSGINQVAVMNDVRAAALAEARRGVLRGAEPGLYLNVGTGVAAAVTSSTGVLAGANQASGEIAYCIDGHSTATEPVPELEDLVGGGPLGRTATAMLGRPISAEDLYRSTDPVEEALAHRALSHLSTALVNMCVLLDPTAVALGGGLAGSADRVLPILRSALARHAPFPPELTVAAFTHEASLFGAIELALDALAVGARPPAADDGPAAATAGIGSKGGQS